MPRRIFTYEAGRGWEIWNQISTIGVFFQGAGILFFVVNLIYSYIKGQGGGRRSMGRMDAGMGDDLAAAGIQFR